MLRRRAVQQRGSLVFSFYCSGRTLLICCLFDLNNSKDMLLYLFLLFSHFIALGSMKIIKPENTEEHVAEGRNINLTCKYDGGILNIQWYQQYQRSRPEFLLYITEEGSIHPTDSDFKAHINKNKKRVHLEIISAKVTDSAVYYCALNYNNNKFLFGSGSKLVIELKEEYEPSYYKVGNDSNTACLATGFSRHNASIFSLFNTTNATLISGDKLYNQVALLSDWDKEECEKLEKPEEKCEDTIEPDPMVNLMALTIMGLRLLFLKTIVFNVLMTFRLWISQ